MSTATTAIKPVMPARHYLNDNYGIRSWLLTKDHKRIAILYLVSITFFFFMGGLFAALIRLELLTPAGDLFTSDTYNKLFSMHGINMVYKRPPYAPDATGFSDDRSSLRTSSKYAGFVVGRS